MKSILDDRQGYVKKIYAVFITAAVLVLLLVAGPANALTLGFSSPSDSTPTKGDIISFVVSMDLNTNEIFPVKGLAVGLSSFPEDDLAGICFFDADGNIVDEIGGEEVECDSDIFLDIERIRKPLGGYGYGYGYAFFHGYDYFFDNFGYGYGYGYGEDAGFYEYNVTVDTSTLDVGNYSRLFIVYPRDLEDIDSEDDVFSEESEPDIEVLAVPPAPVADTPPTSGGAIFEPPVVNTTPSTSPIVPLGGEAPPEEGEEGGEEEETTTEGSVGFLAGITGAVIGALGPVGATIVIIFIIGIIGGSIILRIRRIRLKKK